METNNGIEAQNKVLKYTYLPHRKNINLSHLADIIINNFLPDAYEKYLFQNFKMNPTYRQYRDQIPPYLHGRPPAFIKHCLHRQQKANRKFNANSVVSSDDVNGLLFVENRVPITMLILANQVAHLPALVETGPRPTFHVNIFCHIYLQVHLEFQLLAQELP